MPEGSITKRCGCRDPGSGKPAGNNCPKLRRASGTWSSEHGHWQYQLELPVTTTGQRRQLRRSGFDSYRDALAELDHARALLALAGRARDRRTEIGDLLQSAAHTRQPLPDVETIRTRLRANASLAEVPTVADYLTGWLAALNVDANTQRGYACHVRVHLIPHLGDIRLDKLKPRHIRAMFAAIADRNTEIRAAKASTDPSVRDSVRGIRPTGPATCQRIRATLRKAINDALAEEVIAGITNPATLVKTPGDKARPIVWEPERVAHWRHTGRIPGPVMVWTDDVLVAFLDHAATHDPDLYPMFHLMAYRGPRRGEACGLLDAEVRLGSRETTINNQIAVHGHTLVQKPPKSDAGNRDLILDDDTVAVLTSYKARRAAQRLAAGPDWPDTGLFFVRPDGRHWHPNLVTRRFNRLVRQAGLPPIRLHDLRHGAATMALDAGVEAKVVSEQLGHSTITLTYDTYTSVVKRLHHEAADAVAKKIKNRRKSA
ncbi:tyrosine-type recombinase/integrase [Phytohabitans aurantiacus]|uniref:Site-specific integrase n=1 Tax=Phytohabitans aurantiacus TaxID=3016789 RepID=A0ABQ5QU31_9ACTN|nr:site-specific integrase [Phytohabitans aurantiacus]GLH97790.1 site-specific integrase [Phytohabitans aurantiacus]